MDSDFKSKWEFHCCYLIFFSLFTGDHFQRLELFSPGFCPSCLHPLLIVLLFPTCLVSPGPRCLVSSLCIKALFSLLPLGCSSLLMWSLQTFESVVFHAFRFFLGFLVLTPQQSAGLSQSRLVTPAALNYFGKA